MQTEALKILAIEALNDLQAIDLVAIDVRSLTTITDYMIICSGRSTRHVKSLADSLASKAKSQQISYVHMEGDQENEWVIVDLGDVVAHVMLPNVREFYNLEELWEPVKIAREKSR